MEHCPEERPASEVLSPFASAYWSEPAPGAQRDANLGCPADNEHQLSSGLGFWISGFTGSAADAARNDRGVCYASSLARGAAGAAASRSTEAAVPVAPRCLGSKAAIYRRIGITT